MTHAPLTETDLQTLERRILIIDTPDSSDETFVARVDAQQAWYRESFEIVEHLIATVRALRLAHDEAAQEVLELKEWRDVVAPMLTGTPSPPTPRTLEQDLAHVINSHSWERMGGNTPDFLLAEYLTHCLVAFGEGVRRREVWYGQHPSFDPAPVSRALDNPTQSHNQGDSI